MIKRLSSLIYTLWKIRSRKVHEILSQTQKEIDVLAINTEISDKYIRWKNFIRAEDLYLFDITQNDLLYHHPYI